MPQSRSVSIVDTEDVPSVRVTARGEPSADLLDRALAGWERFLGTLQEASDE
ncbi:MULTISPECIES: hypothetical protein [unclassified Streptomyces]|uniref:hypothetical protein n=1 Tax=unclassified Streptomyces TaxID=2593676 RepID=UPI002DDBD9A4|nr:hypothetical protein [Streptomyces sp. NBC_01294]WRZ58743.1 hypothetical protein OG534_20950 [Streptomyces sp. NBC_01294]